MWNRETCDVVDCHKDELNLDKEWHVGVLMERLNRQDHFLA